MRCPMSVLSVACLVLSAVGCSDQVMNQPVKPPPQTASAVRKSAVDSLNLIEKGDDAEGQLTHGTRGFAQTLGVARSLLKHGSENEEVRRRGFLSGESKQFREAYERFLQTRKEPDKIKARKEITGVEWGYFLVDPDSSVGNALELTLEEAPLESLDAVLWALTETDAKNISDTTNKYLPRLSTILSQRLSRAPSIDPTAFREFSPLELENLDFEVFDRVRRFAFDGSTFPEESRVGLIYMTAAHLVSSGKTRLEVSKDAVEFILRSNDPTAVWERVIQINSAARKAEKLDSAERFRHSNGRMLQAYVAMKVSTSPATEKAISHWLAKYLEACSDAHRVSDDQPVALSGAERFQHEVFEALMSLVPDPKYKFLDSYRSTWRSEVVRFTLAADLAANAAFPRMVRKFDAAVKAHPTLAPGLLDLLSWRPEFWGPGTWGDSGPFGQWPQDRIQAARGDVDMQTRLLSRFLGTDRSPLEGGPGDDVDRLLGWVEERVKNQKPEVLQRIYLAAAKSVSEADLYTVPEIKDENDESKVTILKAIKETDALYDGLLDDLAKLDHTPTPNTRAIIDAVVERYLILQASGPCSRVPTADGFNFYDLLLGDGFSTRYLPLLARMGASPRTSEDRVSEVGEWRMRVAHTLFWLAAGRAHERLAERHYFRAGFVFDPDKDFSRKQTISSIRAARRHFLAARGIYQSLCIPKDSKEYKHPFGDWIDENRHDYLPVLVPTPLQVPSLEVPAADGRPKRRIGQLAVVVQDGLMRTKIQLSRLDAGLDATGHNGAIQKIGRFEDLSERLRKLADLIGKLESAKAESVTQELRVQAADLAAQVADLRVAAQAERVAAAELEMGQAKLGVERAKWTRNITDAEQTAQHFATEAARQHALGAKAHAERSLVMLNKANYKSFVVDAQIELILAALPQYVVELQHSRVMAQKTQGYLNQLADQLDQRHKEYLENRPKDVLGFITKLATFLVDAVCSFYGLPPLGSIVNTAAHGAIDLAEGRTGEGINKLVRSFEMGGGQELLEKGLNSLGKEIDRWEWVKGIKQSVKGNKPGGESGAIALIRGFGQSALPDDFTSLFEMDAKTMSRLMLDLASDPDETAKGFKAAVKQVGDLATNEQAWKEFLTGQALAARKRLYRAGLGLGIREATSLIGKDPEKQQKFRKFLKDRLGQEVKDEDKIIEEMTEGIKNDALAGLKERLTEIYKPMGDLRRTIADRSAKARENQQGAFIEYLQKKHGLSAKQAEELVTKWRQGKEDALAPIKDAARADVNKLLKDLQNTVTSEEFWKGLEQGRIPAGIEDLGWLPSLAENLLDGSLSAEMMQTYSQSSPEKNQQYGTSLKAALVAIRASIDIPVTVHITKRFELQEKGAEVKVSKEWEDELQRLLEEYYDEEGGKAKLDIERYWINIKDTFSQSNISEKTREILSNPPQVTLPADIRKQLEDFDRASAEVNAVCKWLLNAQHFKEQMDQLVKIEEENDYRTARKDFFDQLQGELNKALEKLDPAIDIAGFPYDRNRFVGDLGGVIEKWAQEDLVYIQSIGELEGKTKEKTDLEANLQRKRETFARLPQGNFQRGGLMQEIAQLESKLQGTEARIKELEGILAPLRRGRDEDKKVDKDGKPIMVQGRADARKKMDELFGMIEPIPRNQDELDDDYRNRQFKATKDKVTAMKARITDQASGLFATVSKFDRDAYEAKFDQAAANLDNIANTHAALAFGLQAAQSRALFNASGFRKKRAEVEYAIAEGYVAVTEKHLAEQVKLLEAAQVEFQRSRTHLDLAKVDAWLHERLTSGQDLYNTPASRRQAQKAVWRTARDAAFFVRVYNGLTIDLPTPAVYWSPAAIKGYAGSLDEARKQAELMRQKKFGIDAVNAVLTIDKRLLEERGHTFQDSDGVWTRIRIAVRPTRGVDEDRLPVLITSPYVSRTSWFLTEDEVAGRWAKLRKELKEALVHLSLRWRKSPTESWARVFNPDDLGKMSAGELLISLNDALTRIQPPEFYNIPLPTISAQFLRSYPGYSLHTTALAPSKRRRDAGASEGEYISRLLGDTGPRVLVNRMFLEAWLPRSLPRAVDGHQPHTIYAMETGLERTIFKQAIAFIRLGSTIPMFKDADARIKIRHLGDGWITVKEPNGGIRGVPIRWEAQGFDTVSPSSASTQELEVIQNNPVGAIGERIERGSLPKDILSQSFSTYYPFMGTYELLIPEGMLGDNFQYQILLLGSSVESAR